MGSSAGNAAWGGRPTSGRRDCRLWPLRLTLQHRAALFQLADEEGRSERHVFACQYLRRLLALCPSPPLLLECPSLPAKSKKAWMCGLASSVVFSSALGERPGKLHPACGESWTKAAPDGQRAAAEAEARASLHSTWGSAALRGGSAGGRCGGRLQRKHAFLLKLAEQASADLCDWL